jgi:hypothetical protein
VNTGKGQRAQYGIEEVLLIALAIELLQLGMTPERASGVISSGRDVVLNEFKRALDTKTRIFGGTSALMYLDPRALLDLQDEDLFRVKVGKAYEALFFGTEGDLGKHFQRRQHAAARLAVLDLRRVATDILTFIEAAEIGTTEEAIKEIVDWALDNGSNKKA